MKYCNVNNGIIDDKNFDNLENTIVNLKKILKKCQEKVEQSKNKSVNKDYGNLANDLRWLFD